jgi:hypothetical protein
LQIINGDLEQKKQKEREDCRYQEQEFITFSPIPFMPAFLNMGKEISNMKESTKK